MFEIDHWLFFAQKIQKKMSAQQGVLTFCNTEGERSASKVLWRKLEEKDSQLFEPND